MPRAERRGKTCGDVQIRWKFIAAISIFCRDGCTNVAGCKPNCCTQPRATPWGNAPCGVKGVMGYALSARGIFAQAQKCRMYQSLSTFPQGVALGYGQHLGFQPAPTIYQPFVQIGSFTCTFGGALKRTEICFLARALRINFPEKPFNPALTRITVCNQTSCECMVCTSNPSLMKGCVLS